MHKFITIVTLLTILLGTGLLGTFIAGDTFALSIGGIFGFLIGVTLSIWQTLHTPEEIRNCIFTTHTGDRYGRTYQHDSRYVFTLI